MFYAHFVLSKKGPLAKVWLAAHWDKKLTKSHVFETDVEKTVDDIISPKVKMALRTSGHLLLGVVRIYSRKQKYLIQDLGEACAKIKMAFRPGVVDLPLEGAIAVGDTITLPEIFQNFEMAVADLGSGDMEVEFTKHRSRAEDITLRDENTNSGMFTLYDDFNLQSMDNDEFGEMLKDIEVPRKSTSLQDNSEISDLSRVQLPEDASKDNLMETDQDGVGGGHLLVENQRDDFGGFGLDDFGREGLQEDLLNVPNLPQLDDLNFDVSSISHQQPPPDPSRGAGGDEAMEVEDKSLFPVPNETMQEDEGFVLEPVEVTGVRVRQKRKRKLVVDDEKELKSSVIESQLRDASDTLRQKIFQPPSKKALIFRETNTSEYLYHNPTMQNIPGRLSELVTRNLRFLSKSEMNFDTSILQEIELPREDVPPNSLVVNDTLVVPPNDDGPIPEVPPLDDAHQFDMLDDIKASDEPLGVDERENLPLVQGDEEEEPVRIIPDLPDFEVENKEEDESGPGVEGEDTNEKEEKRLNKRTQQVLKILDKCFNQTDTIRFRDISRKSSRKQAASRFYSCLLLAKDGTIQFKQKEPYSEILIEQGPSYTKVA